MSYERHFMTCETLEIDFMTCETLEIDFMTYEITILISFELYQWRVEFCWQYKIHYKDRQILEL